MPSEPRILFLDIDGTLAYRGVVPNAHVEAVRAVRAAGHRVLLATGRPRSMLNDELLGIGFDGLVGSAGCYAELDGEVLLDRVFPRELAEPLVHRLLALDALFILEARDEVVAPTGGLARLEAAFDAIGDGTSHRILADIGERLRESDDLDVPFAKVTVFGSPVPVVDIAEDAGPLIGCVPNSIVGLAGHAGELHLADANKGVGIDVVLARLGLDRSASIGIGDGLNDLEMLEHAGTAVVVEGADPRVLAHADLVIPGPDRDGLVTAFERLGLLPQAA